MSTCKNVLVIGGGGREHALCWKLAQSSKVGKVFVAPGNPGIASEAKVETSNVDIKDFKAVAKWCHANSVSLVVVGPENPLNDGISDALSAEGLHCFGPSQAAAQIECNKDWAKSFMDRHGLPTARWKSFQNAEEAKKFIKTSQEKACDAVETMLTQKQFGSASETVVVEELLQGEEVSVLGFSDGKTVRVMLPAQDHKRLLAGDNGPNTGGMGAYCPAPFITQQELQLVEQNILAKTVTALAKEGTPFVGVLYAGLMMTKDGPKLLEFNCRFGDPETQVILPLLKSDLYDVMLVSKGSPLSLPADTMFDYVCNVQACCEGKLASLQLEWRPQTHAVGVVLASQGYPASSGKGQPITGIAEVSQRPDCQVFHSGTQKHGVDGFATNGGRVLIAVSLAPRLCSAAAQATKAAADIKFEGAQFRKDIAHKGIVRDLLCAGNLTYKASGVDINAGNTLVSNIKLCAEQTKRPGCMGSIGGFGGVFDLKAAGYKDPLLVSGTDGVGTKLKVAQECAIHDTIGEDLVAMCVNDVLAHAAEPLFFLDYFACGRLEVGMAADVVEGPGDYDVAGFAVGAVERGFQLPRIDDIIEGDVILGLPSSGLHSNGFSLVRRVMEKIGHSYAEPAPFSTSGKTFGQEFLTPTKIYPRVLLPALRSGHVKAFAHITGGGLLENIPRVLPRGLGATLNAEAWRGVCASELLLTLNCGLGGVLVVAAKDLAAVSKLLGTEPHHVVGSITKVAPGGDTVKVLSFTEVMERLMRPFLPALMDCGLRPVKRRVGVLISGSGSNLQALLEHTNNPTLCSAAEIVLVISNKPAVKGLERAERFNVPTKVICHTSFGSRIDFDHEIDRTLREAGVEIVCLAGFMRVLTAEFVKKWRGHIINIHPALLPLFKGTHAHRQALQAGVKVTGCSVHFVEADVDAGAIIVQEAVPIQRGDTEETLQERVLVAEHRAFPRALEMLARGDVYLDEHGQLAWND
ncbi:hypothetical protein B566_EDAN012482 [Ephemera danica]|nr:hypothetical protein B566_EDAN012482 [Ephemera danica]